MIRSLRILIAVIVALGSLQVAAAGRPLAPRTLAPTAWWTLSPITAYAGGRFLTIWQTGMGGPGRSVMAAFSDANGVRISPRSFPLDVPASYEIDSYRLIPAGDSFTLFWMNDRRATHMADVDLEGRVSNVRQLALPDHRSATYAWNGTHYLGILDSIPEYAADVVLFDRDGRLVLPPTPLRGTAYAFDVVVSGDRFVVVSSGFEGVTAQEVTPAGISEQTYIDLAAASPYSRYRPRRVVAAPAANGGMVVVWAASSVGLGHLKSAIVQVEDRQSCLSRSSTGRIACPPLLTVTVSVLLSEAGGNYTPLEVLPAGDGSVVAFTSGESVHRMRLDAAGAHTGSTERVVEHVLSDTRSAAASPTTILVPFKTSPAYHPQVFTAAIAADGSTRTELVTIGFTLQKQPVLSAGRGSVLAVWEELTGDSAAVRATTIDADGNPGTPLQLAGRSLPSSQTAWNGGHHLVLQHDGIRLLATRVTADGVVADATPIVLANTFPSTVPIAGVAWNGTHWIVVWADGTRLRSIAVSRDGTPSDARTLDVQVPLGEQRLLFRPALAFNGRRLLLTWGSLDGRECTSYCKSWSSRTFAARLTRSGATYDRVPVDLGIDNPPSIAAASSGDEFLVIAGSQVRILDELRGELRITASRDLLDWPAPSGVTWDGTNYVVALRYSALQWYLGVLRLDRALNDAAPRAGTATLAPYLPTAPGIAAPFGGNTLVGIDEGTAADGISATLYRERDLAPLPLPPGPPRNVQVRMVDVNQFEIEWDAPAAGEVDSYVVEYLSSNRWFEAGHVPADVRHFRFGIASSDPVFRVRAFNAGGPSR